MHRESILLLAFLATVALAEVDYTGHEVLSVVPRNHEDIEFLLKLRSDYGVDLWNEPRALGKAVLFHLQPHLIEAVKDTLKQRKIEHDVVFHDLQSVIMAEKIMYAPTNVSHEKAFDFGAYHRYKEVVQLIKSAEKNHPTLAKLTTIGQSYENRPIYNLKISSGNSANKPAIMMECGIHAREWSSVAACVYLINKFVTTYDNDSTVKALLDKYEFNIVFLSNPDGYIYSWTKERLWRKTRSHSDFDWLGVCRGADANRNFDVQHCGPGTSRKPCDEEFCGDKPFSESESRALRDQMIALKDRLKAYFSIHAFSQLWMFPYGNTKKLPPNNSELERVANAGATALRQKYGTEYEVGTIANVIYEATGSSVDYIYQKLGVNLAYALELRDTGRFGFFLPKRLILPMCEETYDGLVAAIQAIN